MYINFKTMYQTLIQYKCSKHAVWKGWIVFSALGKKVTTPPVQLNLESKRPQMCSAIFYVLVSRTLCYSVQVRPMLSHGIGHWLSYTQSFHGPHWSENSLDKLPDNSIGSVIPSKEQTPRHGWGFLNSVHDSSLRVVNKWKHWKDICHFPSIFSVPHIT